jgi:beta-glucanase (GH16 family)
LPPAHPARLGLAIRADIFFIFEITPMFKPAQNIPIPTGGCHRTRVAEHAGKTIPSHRLAKHDVLDWLSNGSLALHLSILLVGLLLGLSSPHPAMADTPPHGVWKLVPQLSDDFTKPKINTGKWETRHLTYWGRAPGLISPSNLTLNKGVLNLWTKLDNSARMPRGYNYTTGFLRSRRTFQYGYLEARMKVAPVAVDQALYLYEWRTQGNSEIDVAEMAPGAAGHERLIHTTLHSYAGPPELESHATRLSSPMPWSAPFDPTADFHVYGLERDGQVIRFYVDNVMIREEVNTHWQRPMNIILSSEIILDWFGKPQDADLPSYFSVDYLKVWKRTR